MPATRSVVGDRARLTRNARSARQVATFMLAYPVLLPAVAWVVFNGVLAVGAGILHEPARIPHLDTFGVVCLTLALTGLWVAMMMAVLASHFDQQLAKLTTNHPGGTLRPR